MPGKNVLLTLSFLLLMSARDVVADDGDRVAILALMDKAFYAVGSGDPDDMRAIQLANWMWTVEKDGCPTDPSAAAD